jgi:hypothetical protein
VYSDIAAEVAKNPLVEEGGKYVGHLLAASDSRLQKFGLDHSMPAILIADFLPSGPNAIRTAVELQPDGEYQERLFRQLEQFDREIEHVGTWHTHHCNGLQTLSSGDIAGYLRTVNKTAYRPDYFLASLVVRLPRGASDQEWIDHYLFVRGDKKYYKITKSVKIVDWPTKFGQITGHSTHIGVRAVSGQTEEQATRIAGPDSGVWYESAPGRQTLADDRRFFAAQFKGDVVATRRGQSITLAGRIGRVIISMTYPSNPNVSKVTVSVHSDNTAILEINSELRHRRLAMNAALAVAAKLV